MLLIHTAQITKKCTADIVLYSCSMYLCCKKQHMIIRGTLDIHKKYSNIPLWRISYFHLWTGIHCYLFRYTYISCLNMKQVNESPKELNQKNVSCVVYITAPLEVSRHKVSTCYEISLSVVVHSSACTRQNFNICAQTLMHVLINPAHRHAQTCWI